MNLLATSLNRALYFVGLIGAETSKEKSNEEMVARLMRALGGSQETPQESQGTMESQGTIVGWIQSWFKNPGEEEVSLALKQVVEAQNKHKEIFTQLIQKPRNQSLFSDPLFVQEMAMSGEVERVILKTRLLLVGNKIGSGHELSKQFKNLEKESSDRSTTITKMKYEALTGQKLGSKL